MKLDAIKDGHKKTKNKTKQNKTKQFKYLQDGKVLEDAVHHVLFWQVFELVDKVDHVLAHGRPMDAVDEASVLESSVFRFHFLHDLFAKRADFRRTRNRHILVAFVPFVFKKAVTMCHSFRKKRGLVLNLLGSDGVKCSDIFCDVGTQIGPEFHQEKRVLRSFVKKFLQTTFFLGEFVVNLPDINRLKENISIHLKFITLQNRSTQII
jgi:hypothetical protein